MILCSFRYEKSTTFTHQYFNIVPCLNIPEFDGKPFPKIDVKTVKKKFVPGLRNIGNKHTNIWILNIWNNVLHILHTKTRCEVHFMILGQGVAMK